MTYSGAEKFIQVSQNKNAKKYKAEILALIHVAHAQISAGMGKRKYTPHGVGNFEPSVMSQSTMLTVKWPNKRSSTPDDFENAVTCFFSGT